MKAGWFLASNLPDATGRDIVKIYEKRFTTKDRLGAIGRTQGLCAASSGRSTKAWAVRTGPEPACGSRDRRTLRPRCGDCDDWCTTDRAKHRDIPVLPR